MTDSELLQLAEHAREKAYAPYSRFKVGAALLTKDQQIFCGCNVENAAYGLCNCAERTAFFSAIAAGYKPGDFLKLAVIADTVDPISPCGACRQVIQELGGESLAIILGNLHGESMNTTSSALLPGAFSRTTLNQAT
ncbi:cytidine deaminase [Undibacterium sp. LX40W]|uniref:Cytidine deaminase n=2 Tax=Undibacterium TaxID=401469 RepID=A0A923HTT8_9BURK|nr:cytidine deaminase [Undibacterium sp. LX40W]MBC3881079.1 cytidine deaminase [Undibacterium nitidum]MBC3890188.1 cytidine deaminase [Undibacterium sp. LX40W]